jgi:hypothetical protein
MKTAASILITLITSAFVACGQLVLQQGQSWSYQFNFLPMTGTTNALLATLGGTFQFTMNSGSFQPGSQLRYEMFENTSSDAPICSGTVSLVPPSSQACSSPGAWQDLQGAIRFTMLSGSVEIDRISLQAITISPSLSSDNVNQLDFTPVPEPSIKVIVVALCGLAIILSCDPLGATGRTR